MLEEVCVDGRISYGTQRTRILRVRSRKTARDDQEASIPVCYVRASLLYSPPVFLSSDRRTRRTLHSRALVLPLASPQFCRVRRALQYA